MKTPVRLPHALLLAAAMFATTPATAYVVEGKWFNDSFGSEGSVRIDVTLTATDFTLEVDLGGFVFGLEDPDPFILSGPIDAGGTATIDLMDDPFFGDVSGTITATGAVDIAVSDLPTSGGVPPFQPGDRIASATASGIFDGTLVDLDYFILFTGANCSNEIDCIANANGTEQLDYAVGRIEGTVVPLPPALLLMAPALAVLAGLRRPASPA